MLMRGEEAKRIRNRADKGCHEHTCRPSCMSDCLKTFLVVRTLSGGSMARETRSRRYPATTLSSCREQSHYNMCQGETSACVPIHKHKVRH